MQVVDANGNIFGNGLEITGPDGKPKILTGGGSPTGSAGGDLNGTYPNPGVEWNNGLSTYNSQYYPLSTNPSGYLTSSALSNYLTITSAASTYYPLTNPSGYITNAALSSYLTSATAASTYYPLTNPSGYLTSSALSPYLTSALAASTYYRIPTGTTSQYIRGDGSFANFPNIPLVTPSALTKVDDTNVTLTLGGNPSAALLENVSLTVGWTGELSDSRIASANTWNAKQDPITLTTTGSSGPATLVGTTLNIPEYSGGGGGGTPFIDTQIFTASGVWTKPTGAKQVEIFLFGGGGGGGSGRRGAASSARYGGGGGATGGVYINKIDAASLDSTENIWIGAGGNGANIQTTDNTNGTNGFVGQPSFIGGIGTENTAKIIAPRGAAGAGGTNTSNGSGQATPQSIYGVYATSNYGSQTANANGFTTTATYNMRPLTAGAYGGGIDAVNNRFQGSGIVNRTLSVTSSLYNILGGNLAGENGINGTVDYNNPNFIIMSIGGTGGASGNTVGTIPGGKGGDGAICCGGGGGGASTNGASSGAGGRGGDGFCMIITYF